MDAGSKLAPKIVAHEVSAAEIADLKARLAATEKELAEAKSGIREEIIFDANAHSSANAYGLMHLPIPTRAIP